MQILIYIMIFSGSALMVYNIVRYGLFVKKSAGLEIGSRKTGLLAVPLILLVFFLIGYLVIGFSGVADLMMASILLGGSIFVFLMLMVMYSIIAHIRETDQILSQRYGEMKERVRALSENALAVMLVNLTRDEIEDLGGTSLYESDYATDRYSEVLLSRSKNVFERSAVNEKVNPLFRESLLNSYKEGRLSVSETMLVRLKNGRPGFVRLDVTLSKMPVSGDIIAMITENLCDREVVQDKLLEKVMMEEYDRIAYLIDGEYYELLSDASKQDTLLLPPVKEDSYESLYLNYILPAYAKSNGKPAGPNPLRLSYVDKMLAESGRYSVSLPFTVNGAERFKNLNFYCINREAKFYILLISESSGKKQEEAGSTAAPEPGPSPEPETLREPETAPEPEKEQPETTAADESVQSLRVLLADDNEINREIAVMMLSSEGWTVDEAKDGKEALDIIKASEPGQYDIVLMDVQMPVMNGYEATRAIRALDSGVNSVPIIAMTANAFEEDVKDALNAGMNGHVSKPVDPETLKKTIKQILSERQ